MLVDFVKLDTLTKSKTLEREIWIWRGGEKLVCGKERIYRERQGDRWEDGDQKWEEKLARRKKNRKYFFFLLSFPFDTYFPFSFSSLPHVFFLFLLSLHFLVLFALFFFLFLFTFLPNEITGDRNNWNNPDHISNSIMILRRALATRDFNETLSVRTGGKTLHREHTYYYYC